jgi:hypothetical protein
MIEDLFDDPDFAGVVFQHYHVTGDEHVKNGCSQFAPRSVGRDLVQHLMDRHSDEFEVRPVFWRD